MFAVCDSAVAAICTSGMSTGRPRQPPSTRSSNRSNRTGAQNSISAITAANGDFNVTRVNSNTFSLDGSTGNGSYTSGGTWHVSGLYDLELDVLEADGYESGETYTIYVSYTISGTVRTETYTFTAV